jgi:hypothetical protein
LAALLVIALATGAAIVLSESARSSADTPSPNVLAHYSVFSSTQTASDSLPADAPWSASLSRRQPTRYPGIDQWATVDRDTICAVSETTHTSTFGPGRICDEASTLEQDGQLLIGGGATGSESQTPGVVTFLYGLAPDGISSIDVAFTDGSSQTVPVLENGFQLALEGKGKVLAHVTWRDASGQTHSQEG